MRPICSVLLLAAIAGCAVPEAGVSGRRDRLQRRAAGGPSAIPELARALDDENPLIRRQAARLLLEMGEPAKGALIGAMGNEDLLVRRTALRAAARLSTAEALPYLERGIADKSEVIRHEAVSQLAAIRPQTPDVSRLLGQASNDEVGSIRAIAQKALWPFYREVKSIRTSGEYDHDVKVAQAIPLPKDGWRFQLDAKRDGHTKRWFEPGFNDAKWRMITIEQAWQKAGVQYIGVAWYRRTIDLPPKPKHVAVELHFKGVDESAWVWVNGIYVGQHDVGPSGWDQAFTLDVTKELKWGAENQITVRAMNTANAGGIWRPVFIEVLE